MAKILINHREYTIDGIVFDKDGTLIDFNETWGPILQHAVNELVKPFDDADKLSSKIYNTLGVDQQTLVATEGPYAITTFDKMCTVVATVLYQHGIKWTHAEQQVFKTFKVITQTPPAAEYIKATANIAELFSHFKSHNIKVGIATADNRLGTIDTLKHLDCDTESLFIACGDDLNLPSKPNPALLENIASQWHINVKNLAMVGDTVGDVYMAQQASAISIGVLTGAGTNAMLAPYCDEVIDSINDLNQIC